MLIQKSVRLPADLIEYVENQEGVNFSQKMVTLLEDIRKGEAKRQKMTASYEEQIEQYRSRLNELRNEVYDMSLLLRKVSEARELAEQLLPEDEPAESI